MQLDYFISHASEDNTLIAGPLARLLHEGGFKVWYDGFALKVGDSLSATIGKGLRQASYGIVILSPFFFAKEWPQRELAALTGRESGGILRRLRLRSQSPRIILPIWYHVNTDDVKKYAPNLADRKGASCDLGLQAVAEQIVRATFPDRLDHLPLTNANDLSNIANAKDTFEDLLSREPPVEDIRMFISAYQGLLKNIVGFSPLLIPSYKLRSSVPFDFALVTPQGTTGPIEVQLVVLGPISDTGSLGTLLKNIEVALGPKLPFGDRRSNDYLGLPHVGEYASISEPMRRLSTIITDQNIHWNTPEVWRFKFLVIAGRRRTEGIDHERDVLVKSLSYPVGIASYDRLLD